MFLQHYINNIKVQTYYKCNVDLHESQEISIKNSFLKLGASICDPGLLYNLTLSLLEQLKIKKFPAVKLQGIARGR